MRIGIIGGGWTGLVLARKLMDRHEITLFEREGQLGGLATYQDYDHFFWDRFYHVILPMDRALLDFIDEIGLADQVRWNTTRTGVYVDEQFYSVSNTLEFLRFPPLNLVQKFRLALTILIGSRVSDWRQLEKVTVEDWLVRYSGRTTYEKFWKPLLLAKLGPSYRRVSAVFIWTYIKRLFEARGDSTAKKEQMGYISGGYKTLLDALEQQLTAGGVRLRCNTQVGRITPAAEGGLEIHADGKTSTFDKVIFTGPTNVLERLADAALLEVRGDSRKVEYLGVVCMVLLLREPLTPFYVLNIADESIPFTGVIGMSTLVDRQETAGYELVYLPKYVLSDEEILRRSDEEIYASFLKGLQKMYPALSEADIASWYVNRAIKVQPLQVLNYSQIVPQVATRHPDLFVLNTAQFLHDTLNNDSVTRQVNRFIREFEAQLSEVEKSVFNEP